MRRTSGATCPPRAPREVKVVLGHWSPWPREERDHWSRPRRWQVRLWQAGCSSVGARSLEVRIENMTDEAILVFGNFIFGGTKARPASARRWPCKGRVPGAERGQGAFHLGGRRGTLCPLLVAAEATRA